jgi:hypothetical protein
MFGFKVICWALLFIFKLSVVMSHRELPIYWCDLINYSLPKFLKEDRLAIALLSEHLFLPITRICQNLFIHVSNITVDLQWSHQKSPMTNVAGVAFILCIADALIYQSSGN